MPMTAANTDARSSYIGRAAYIARVSDTAADNMSRRY